MPVSPLHSQELFTEQYQRECKRSERSGRPFLLMLIDLSRLAAVDVNRYLDAITKHLHDTTRGSDCKGWYRNRRVIGVIFTELQQISAASFRLRLLEGFRDSPGHDPAGLIALSSYLITGTVKKAVSTAIGQQVNGTVGEPELVRRPSVRKRSIDIIGALFGIVFFSPAFIIIAILLKTTSRGPVVFRQERVGRAGKPFRMFKFRSMYVDNDDSIHREFVSKLIKGEIDGATENRNEKLYKIDNDPRVTAIGRFLRKTSLDELPQFFNVLKGEMSLVGPRPAIPYEVAQYDLWHRRRVSAKPGITGLWQVEGRSSTTFDGMVRLDIRYIKRCSLLFDLLIILKTPFSLFSVKGAF
ncbi:MAG: sugar transferase [Chitinispirillaceae bacterium]|nr:sugar transferase [Chitinispirillaceae bacterium]